MKKAVLYFHGKGGNAAEAEHYRPLFPQDDVIGVDYQSVTPWEAAEEFPKLYSQLLADYDEVSLIANSIGAFLCMSAPVDRRIKRAYFISPVVDMEKLITDMMQWACVTEEQLREKQEIQTSFGEVLSWRYLCYVREHPLSWPVPTYVVYGDKDHLTALPTMERFAEEHGASLTVMENGEHWFHTPEQMRFLDRWLTGCLTGNQ